MMWWGGVGENGVGVGRGTFADSFETMGASSVDALNPFFSHIVRGGGGCERGQDDSH